MSVAHAQAVASRCPACAGSACLAARRLVRRPRWEVRRHAVPRSSTPLSTPLTGARRAGCVRLPRPSRARLRSTDGTPAEGRKLLCPRHHLRVAAADIAADGPRGDAAPDDAPLSATESSVPSTCPGMAPVEPAATSCARPRALRPAVAASAAAASGVPLLLGPGPSSDSSSIAGERRTLTFCHCACCSLELPGGGAPLGMPPCCTPTRGGSRCPPSRNGGAGSKMPPG
eukprot:361797-Chlamydomonas_euryale.AAC.5